MALQKETEITCLDKGSWVKGEFTASGTVNDKGMTKFRNINRLSMNLFAHDEKDDPSVTLNVERHTLTLLDTWETVDSTLDKLANISLTFAQFKVFSDAVALMASKIEAGNLADPEEFDEEV
jgi:hypothetical protein